MNVVNNTSNKSIIVIDIDDVLSDYASFVMRFARREFNEELTHDEMSENWSKMFNISQQEWLQAHEKFLKEEKFYEKAPVIDGALNTLEKLRPKFDLIVLTSRPMFLRDDTLKWLNNNFPDMFSEILFSNIWDKYSSDGSNLHTLSGHTKAETCQEIGASYLIDDQPKHVSAAAECGIKSLLFGNYGWSRRAEIADGVTRVADWAEVANYFGV
jgi:uncharacterized HAD superfamily protein